MLLGAFACGAAALAVWAYVRWPGAAPATLRAAVLHVLAAVLLLQVGSGAVDFGLRITPVATAVVVVVAAVLSVLTYAFLAALWFLRFCADSLRGA